VGFIVASEKWLDSLPANLRQAVLEAGREATLYEFEQVAPDYLARDRAVMREAGMEFSGRPADFETWKTLGRKSWPACYRIIGNGDEAAGRSLVEKARAAWQ
jgi:TRAP-type C4-dicarboxylate transport system substrate-binding protein